MELEHIKAQITENTERIKIIQEESKRFKEPLDQARATERTLKKQLETYPKDKMALKNAKARLKVLKAKYSQMIEDQEELDKKYKLVYIYIYIYIYRWIKREGICVKSLRMLVYI